MKLNPQTYYEVRENSSPDCLGPYRHVATFVWYEDAVKCKNEQWCYDQPAGIIQLVMNAKTPYESFEDWKNRNK